MVGLALTSPNLLCFFSYGLGRLEAARDAWVAVLRQQPRLSLATVRLAWVEAELAVYGAEGEAAELLKSAESRLTAAIEASVDAPELYQ
eukprot:6176316-Pleurochrysis_carterae.AAC.6